MSLSQLQQWYRSQCDGNWEHSYGVAIDTLDNPGWSIRIDLSGTSLEDADITDRRMERSEDDWVHSRREGSQFVAFCGPENLEEAIRSFLGILHDDGSSDPP